MSTHPRLSSSRHLGQKRPLCQLLLAASAVTLWAGGCSPGFEPLDLREIQPADEVDFDVSWRQGVVVADEADVLADIHDLNPTNGAFRVDASSALLADLEPGDIVVWPQIGILEIEDLTAVGGAVDVSARYARFGAAVESGRISFSHALTSGEPGRAVGVVEAEPNGQRDDELLQALNLPEIPVDYTEDGLEYEGTVEPYGLDYDIAIGEDRMSVNLSAASGSVTATMTGEIRGLRAEGLILMHPDADDPSVLIEFNDITVNLDVTIEVKGARGSAVLLPPAQLTFPMMIGPVPAYIAVSTRMQVRSSISHGETLIKASAGFSMQGAVVVARNDDGGFGAEGAMTQFESRRPSIEFGTSVTAGVGIDVDAPRISFGVGRPGLAAASIFGTHSAEIVANVTLDTEGEHCATLGTGGAIQVGGEMNFFGWTFGDAVPIATYSGEQSAHGALCN